MRIARGETHAGTLVVSCESLEIDGIVVGDVLAFCERVAIRGEVEGSVFTLGRELELRGSIADNLIALGHQITLDGTVGASAYLGGERLTVGPGGRVVRDAFLGGERVRVEGEVARDLTSFGERHRDRRARWGATSRRGPSASACCRAPASAATCARTCPSSDGLEVADGAVIAGASDVEVLEGHGHTIWSRYRDGRFYTWTAIGFVASFLIGLILHYARAELVRRPHRDGPRLLRVARPRRRVRGARPAGVGAARAHGRRHPRGR